MLHRRALVVAALVAAVSEFAVAGQPLPAPPAALAVTRVAGGQVSLSWRYASADQAPDAYLVEGGFAPGETWARASLPGTATSATFALAEGVYYARLRGVHGGVATIASNEVLVVVGEVRPPSSPEEVAALAVGSDVTLSWRNTYGGGAPADIVLEVSGDLDTVVPLPATDRFTIGGVPNGTYTVALRARNRAGLSARSQAVVVSLPGAAIQVVQGPPLAAGTIPLPVRYETYTTPRLAEFAARERLDTLFDGITSEFEGLLRLKDWVAAQFPEGVPDPYPPWDAMTILDWIRSGRTGGFCAQYAQIFLQALAHYGIPARYVGVGLVDNPIAHFTTEVWSNDFNKWVLLDVHFNVHYERQGVPLSALEVHDAFVRGNDGDLVAVLGTAREGHPDPLAYPHRVTEFFYYLHYHLKANHVTVPGEAPNDLFNDAIGWLDEHTVPWEVSPVPSPFPHIKPTRVTTRERSSVDLGANQVWMTPRRTGPMEFTVDLAHTVLMLRHFEFRVIDDRGEASPWTPHTSPQLTWRPGARDRRLEVRGVNWRGVAGPASAVAVVP